MISKKIKTIFILKNMNKVLKMFDQKYLLIFDQQIFKNHIEKEGGINIRKLKEELG